MRVVPEEIAEIISKRKLTAFSANTGYTDNSVAYRLHQFSFHCGIEDKGKALDSWCSFIARIASRFPTIGSWVPIGPYQSWQNLRGPDDYQYGTYGPLPPGFNTRHEPDKYGIGPGEMLFDNPKNPGHAKVVDGHTVFYPTAEMWLGPHFWPYAKCTKKEALAADFWLETKDTPNYTYFKCWPTPFTRLDGDQGRMQQLLWKLFFHEDCEWPPRLRHHLQRTHVWPTGADAQVSRKCLGVKRYQPTPGASQSSRLTSHFPRSPTKARRELLQARKWGQCATIDRLTIYMR